MHTATSADDEAIASAKATRDAEIAALWARWQSERSPEVRNLLAETYYPLVIYVARETSRSLPHDLEIGDIRGYGAEGLLDAIERFDPARGVLFSTFARHRIRGAIYDRIRNLDWVSRTDRRRERELREHRERFLFEHDRHPTLAEEAELMGATLQSHEALLTRLDTAKMSTIASNGEFGTSVTEIASGDPGPLATWLSAESGAVLREALEELDERSRKVILLSFSDEVGLPELSAELGVTASRVCQIRLAALRTLRASLARRGITTPPEAVVA